MLHNMLHKLANKTINRLICNKTTIITFHDIIGA